MAFAAKKSKAVESSAPTYWGVTNFHPYMQIAADKHHAVVLMLQVLDQTDGGPAPTE
jgi:hypothetical protein